MTRTQSTSMRCGNAVLPSGGPGQAPPTATLKSKKKGLWNSSVLLIVMLLRARPDEQNQKPHAHVQVHDGDHPATEAEKTAAESQRGQIGRETRDQLRPGRRLQPEQPIVLQPYGLTKNPS